MEPLRGGALAASPQPPTIEALWEQAARRRTPAEWALRWLWNQPEVTVVLSGMNEESHVEENLEIAGDARPGSLTAAETDLIDRVAAEYRRIMKVNCTGCGYCLPCPSGVSIPSALGAYNVHHTFGRKEEALFTYAIHGSGVLSGTPGYASLCSRCQDCLDKCPQDIQIPDVLEEVAAQFEGPGLKKIEAIVSQLFSR